MSFAHSKKSENSQSNRWSDHSQARNRPPDDIHNSLAFFSERMESIRQADEEYAEVIVEDRSQDQD